MAIEELMQKIEMTTLTISLSVEMRKEIEKLCKAKQWKVSPFVRVCVQKEFARIKSEG